MKLMILNGWAASPHAWDLCCCAVGPDVRIFSYLEQLDLQPEKALEAAKEPVVVMGWSMGGSRAGIRRRSGDSSFSPRRRG